MSNANEPVRLKGREKALVDYGPLVVFMIAYFWGARLVPKIGSMVGQNWSIVKGEEMYLAISLFIPAFAIAFIYSFIKEKRIAPALLISGVVIGVFGGLTLILKDKTFFYMKPTMINLLFAGLLGFGLYRGRLFLKTVLDDAFQMPDDAWHTLTIRYIIFFIVMALINEALWRTLTSGCDLSAVGVICAGEATWVKVKIFGFTALTILFTGSQLPFLLKHAQDIQPKTDD